MDGWCVFTCANMWKDEQQKHQKKEVLLESKRQTVYPSQMEVLSFTSIEDDSLAAGVLI